MSIVIQQISDTQLQISSPDGLTTKWGVNPEALVRCRRWHKEIQDRAGNHWFMQYSPGDLWWSEVLEL